MDDQLAMDLIAAFNLALNERDLDGMMRRMTADCVFENTDPPPDGSRFEGARAVRAFWQEFFTGSRSSTIEIEDLFGHAGRYTMLWTYHWIDNQGQPGHVRGVDVYRVENGLIAEKLSYVKG
jgi:ketosteroid isomerase-like protein